MTTAINTVNAPGKDNSIKVMANSAYQPKIHEGYGSNVWQILLSIGLILGGASGHFVLRGTNSSEALVVAGFAFLAWDIFSLIKKKTALDKAAKEFSTRRIRMQEEENAIRRDDRALPKQVNVRITCDKDAAALKLNPRLNGCCMTWNEQESAYLGSTSRVRNIVNFNDLDLSTTFEIVPHSGETVMELFRDKTGIGIALPGDVMILPQSA